jgi:nucleotide-binding universal stress UspA family protein
MTSRIVLCAVDFSSESLAAMHEAAAIARASGERLVLLHVQHIPVAPIEMPVMPQAVIAESKAAIEAALADWRVDALDAGAKEVETRLVPGIPWERIVATARELAARLIVIGTHGRTGLKHVLLGSVAEKVARYAPCSVMVTRAGEPHPDCSVLLPAA